MDKFDKVMLELSKTVEKKDSRNRKLKLNDGEKRYKDNYLGVEPIDNAILVFAEEAKDLTFARRVADYYNCEYISKIHLNAPEGGTYELKIFIA